MKIERFSAASAELHLILLVRGGLNHHTGADTGLFDLGTTGTPDHRDGPGPPSAGHQGVFITY